MIKNRRNIQVALVALLVAAMLYMAISVVLFIPAQKIDDQSAALASDIKKMQYELKVHEGQTRTLKRMAKKTMGSDVDRVSENLRNRLVTLLRTSGMGRDLMITPSPGPKRKNYYKEIGWTVTDHGRLGQVLDLLFLLDDETKSYLDRVDNLKLRAVAETGEVEIKFRLATLVLIAPKGKKLTVGVPPEADSIADIGSPLRERYDLIASRDLFRPYLRFVPPPKPRPRPSARPRPKPRPQPQANPDTYSRVVALTNWDGEPEIHVRNTKKNETKAYKIGEEIAGGQIVMIDYRPMPFPSKPHVQSGSRAILNVGRDYWAVELGQMLSQKRRLSVDNLPVELAEEVRKRN